MRHVPGHQVPEGEQKLYGKSGAVGKGTQKGLADLANPSVLIISGDLRLSRKIPRKFGGRIDIIPVMSLSEIHEHHPRGLVTKSSAH